MILTSRFDVAFLMASDLHRLQKRKNIEAPYVCHLMAVASLVSENIEYICKDQDSAEDYVITAVLHDAIEDQGGMPIYDRIRAAFGQRIADYVLLLSHSAPTDLGKREDKKTRNALYLNNMSSAPLGVVLVSCCDKIHNLRTMAADQIILQDKFWGAFSQDPHSTVDNYRKLGKVYEEKLPKHRVIKLYKEALSAVESLLPPVVNTEVPQQ